MFSETDSLASRIAWFTIGLIVVAAVALAVLSQVLPPETEEWLLAESGPFEQMTPWLWVALGIAMPLVLRRMSLGVAAGIVLTLACAAREWDLHKSVTGYSVLKPGFYLSSEYALHHQVIAGVLVLAALASLVVAARLFWLNRPRRGEPTPAWVAALAVAVSLLVFTKVLDRAPKVLSGDAGIELPEMALSLMMSWEEGLEAFLPVAFGAMVLALEALRRAECRTGEAAAG